MKAFAALYTRLDETTRTNAKVDALVDYFSQAPAADAVWALAFLSGHQHRRYLPAPRMRAWAAEAAGIPDWLFAECYDAVGDMGETIALLASPAATPAETEDVPLHTWVEEVLLRLKTMDETAQRETLIAAWASLGQRESFLLNKLIGGSFRVGVSQQVVVKALARIANVPQATLTHRLMGTWVPTPRFYTELFNPDPAGVDHSRPYPFYLAYALEGPPEQLGQPDAWQAEWKWDGIRAQLIHRGEQVYLWSRGEELMTERFPELASLGALLPPGTVLDGEVMPWLDGPLAFSLLQKRIGRKTLSKKILAEIPVMLIAYDLPEWQGQDIRERPLQERRALLETLVATLPVAAPVRISPRVNFTGWDELSRQQLNARTENAEGLMLKRLNSPYGTGRRKGDWWKWKVAPLSLDAVLVYAQRGTGRRASLYTDYTFAVWQGAELVTFAKAYSGLTDKEIAEVDAFVRRNTLEKFGPVRTVKPELVFELGFEGIQASTRHKSGVAVRFPRMLRWRKDKPAAEADTVETLRALLLSAGA